MNSAQRATGFGLTSVRVRGFRTARDVSFELGQLGAFVGEANAGKSNLLAAMRAVLDPGAPPPGRSDVARGMRRIRIEGRLENGNKLTLDDQSSAPPSLFFPAPLRSGALVAEPTGRWGSALKAAVEHFEQALAVSPAPRLALIRGLDACRNAGLTGHVLLIEEPELFLRPQAQRYLYRLLHDLSQTGNQVVYSTHSPSFLNVARLEELRFVERDVRGGTKVVRPEQFRCDEDFRVLSEFDAERGELFLARSAVLVEGLTEKLSLPFVFAALGYDTDWEAISIIECGGKSNIPLFAQICKATGVPFVAVHDRDAEHGKEPIPAEKALNDLIAKVAGRRRTVVLEPDFEGVAGLRGAERKPERAWRQFETLGPLDVPKPLARVVKLAVEQARD